jgi:hypothetical protein
MKQLLTFCAIAILCFGLGWWTHGLKQTTTDKSCYPMADTTVKSKLNKAESAKATAPAKKKISDYAAEQTFFVWQPVRPVSGKYACELSFEPECALYFFHGQCLYYYFTYVRSDTTIDLLWSYKTDCISDLSFLEKPNGVKRYPKHGDIFATYTLVNDTTLKVKYHYPEWAMKVNQIVGDSLYAETLHLRR